MEGEAISLQMELKSFMGDLQFGTVFIGSFQEWFPTCGQSESSCPLTFPKSFEEESFPITSSSAVGSTRDPEKDSNWTLLNLTLLAVFLGCAALTIILIVAITTVIRHRRSHFVPKPVQLEET